MNLKRFWAWPDELREAGIMGINTRNLHLLTALNRRHYYDQANDKIITKQICRQHSISAPESYAVIDGLPDLDRAEETIRNCESAVIKPSRGAGGRGVLVLKGRAGPDFLSANGTRVTHEEVVSHITAILTGAYALRGKQDRVIIEEFIVPTAVFARFGCSGAPDIRIIMYREVPVMAMLRLPTHKSGGRANLHQGAVAAAIDMGTGCTFGGSDSRALHSVHPDSGVSLEGMMLPCWTEILQTAINISKVVELKCIGVDIILEDQRGPLLLEINARPGLAIQLANRKGLSHVISEAGVLLALNGNRCAARLSVESAIAREPEREPSVDTGTL